MNERIKLLQSIAREAGDILMRYRAEGFSIATKTNEFDFVTDADKKADAFLIQKLKAAFPNDKILTEEGLKNPGDTSGAVWMVDPLDGTKHYVANGNGFSVMIGLAVEGTPQIGVVYAPAQNLLYWAEKGQGAWMQAGDAPAVKLHVSRVNKLGEATLIVRYRENEDRPTDAFIENLPVKKRIQESSVGLKIGLIAQGKADAVYNINNRANKWDYCAPEIIMKEAGGMFTDLQGDELDYRLPEEKFPRLTIASNGALHKELLRWAGEINGF